MDKQKDFSEWYHTVLEEAKILDQRYSIKGMLVYRKWGLFILKQMQEYLEKLLEENSHEPVLFPVLIPDNVLGKESEHIAGFEEQVFWVTHAGKTPLERKLALRPTSETSIYDMFSLWIRSHTDLPLKVHQSCAVYRYETKHTRPLIRGREFLWNEGHTAFATNEEAEKNLKEIKVIYGKLINELLCLPFQINKRPDWDKFPGAVYTLAFETFMPDGKVLQVGTAHNLGQNFSKVFNITYEDEEGGHKHVYQTSYGPGFGRLLAAVISIHGDDKGLVLPPQIAPTQVVIIPILFKKSEKEAILDYAEEIKTKLQKEGIRVEIDASEERPGAKYYKWELLGVPLRIEIGPRDLKEGKLTLVRRDTGKKETTDVEKLDVNAIFTKIEQNLRETAQKNFDKNIVEVKNLQEFNKNIGSKIVITGWCGEDRCAPKIESKGTILALTDERGKCVVCGAEGRKIRIGKTY